MPGLTEELKLYITAHGAQAEKELNKIANATTQVGAKADSGLGSLTSRLKDMINPMTIAGTAITLTATAAIKSAEAYQDWGSQVLKTQRVVGGTIEDASKLAFAFKQSGLDTDQAAKSVGIFSKKLEASKDPVAQFGVSLLDAQGNTRSMNDVLLDMADRFASMPNGIEKTALAQNAFGRSGQQMIPFLNRGRQGIEDLMAATEKYGLVLNNQNASEVKDAIVSQRELARAFQGLQVEIGKNVLPTLTKLETQLTKLMLLTDKIPGGVETLFKAFTPLIFMLDMLPSSGDGAAKSFKDLTDQTGEFTASTEDMNTELDDAKTALDKAKKAAKEYTDALQAPVDAEIAYQQAVDDLTDAVEKNGLGLAKNKRDLDYSTEAGRKNMQAAEDVRQAIIDKGMAELDATHSVNAATGAVNNMVLMLYSQLLHLGYTKTAAKAYIDQLNLTPDDVNTIFNTPGLPEAIGNVDELNAKLDKIDGRRIAFEIWGDLKFNQNNPFHAPIPPGWYEDLFSATGGPVGAGQLRIVGEKGPELFVPNTSGQIVPNDKLGGNTYNFNFPNYVGSKQELIRAIRDAERAIA